MKNKKLLFDKILSLFVAFGLLLSISNATFAQQKMDKKFADKKESAEFTLPNLDAKALTESQQKGVLINEAFDVWPPVDWTLTTVGAGWLQGGTTNLYAIHYDDVGAQDDWLITPALAIESGYVLSYDEAIRWNTYNEAHEVVVSLSSDMSDSTVIYSDIQDVDLTWKNISLSLNDYAGQTIYVGFHYLGDYSDWWIVDNVYAGPPAWTEILDLTFGGEENSDAVLDDEAGTVAVEVYKSADITALTPEFTLSPYAQLSPTTAEYLVPTDYTDPVVYEVLAGDQMTIQEWTVTVTKAAEFLTGTDILAVDLGPNIKGDIEITGDDSKGYTVTAQVLYDSTLVITPTFIISERATISPASGVEQDFADGAVTYTVTAEDGTEQEWTVTVTEAPAEVGTDILAIEFPNQVGDVWFDNFARRIEASIMFDSTLKMVPNSIELSPYATISPAADVEVDFATPKVYTVTSESGVSVDWRVTLTNILASSKVDIEDIDFESMIDYDDANDTAFVAWVEDDLVLTAVKPIFELTFGAVITDTTVAKDFSEGPVTYTVTAEDDTTVVAYTLELVLEEDATPTATLMAADTVDNVEGTVEIKSDFVGVVALVLDGETFEDDGDLEDLEEDFVAVMADIEAVNDTVEFSTYGLEEGWYFAYAIDDFSEFVSEESVDSVYVEAGIEEVDNLAEIKALDSWNMKFKVLSEVVVTSIFNADTLSVQDTTAGIFIYDVDNKVTTAYSLADGITGLTGMAMMEDNFVYFVPSANPGAATSTANTIVPMVITQDELIADTYDAEEDEFGPLMYQSMVVKLEKTLLVTDETVFAGDNTSYDLMQAGSDDIQMVMIFNDSDLIGEDIPTVSIDVVGIAGAYDDEAQIYPRKLADITAVTGITFYKEDLVFEDLLVGDSVAQEIGFGNIGAGDITINSVVYSGSDVFTLIEFDSVMPYTLPAYVGFNVEVAFEPDSALDETGMLIVTWNTSMKDTIMITGTGYSEPEFDLPYLYDFEDKGAEGLWSFAISGFDEDDAEWTYGGEGATPFLYTFGNGFFISPLIDLTEAEFPVVTFWNMHVFTVNSNGKEEAIYVSTDKENWELVTKLTKYDDWAVFFKQQVELFDYVGQKIYVKFDYPGSANYWALDNIEFLEQPNAPIFSTEEMVDFNTTAIGGDETLEITIENLGVSFINIDSVYMKGTDAIFALDSTFDFEVVESYDPEVLTFEATFTPVDNVLTKDTIVIEYSDARNSALKAMIAVQGIGVSCETGVDAVIGENVAPGAPYWYTFTAEKDMVVKVSSLQDDDPDTRLFVYANCEPLDLNEEGNDEIAHSEDFAGNLASYVHFFAAEGETYNIYWDDEWLADSFTWTLEIDTTPGEVCEMAIPVTLPLVAFEDSTMEMSDYYNDGMSPCYDYYMGGNDIVYTFTLEEASFVTGSIDGDYVGMHIVGGMLPLPFAPDQTLPTCGGFAADGLSVISFTDRFFPAGTYYIVVSTWPQPQSSVFTIDLSAEVAHREATIMEIQGMDDVTPFEDTYVITTGIVTAVYEDGYYIQDGAGAWNGIQVYDPDNYETVAIGDELRIDGKAKEYYDMTNIEDIITTEVVSSDNDLPAVTDVDVSDIGEAWEGVLVTIGEVTVVEGFNDYDEFVVEDGFGNQLIIDPKIFKIDEVYVGATYTITGIVNYGYGAFRIRPREAADVVTGVEDVTSNVSFDVYPNPSNGQFTVTINSNQMNDLTIELVNVQGEVIYSHRADDVTSFTGDVDVTEFAKGVYYLRVFNGEEVKVEKVIVQ
jgi:type IX secretion system substrate protein